MNHQDHVTLERHEGFTLFNPTDRNGKEMGWLTLDYYYAEDGGKVWVEVHRPREIRFDDYFDDDITLAIRDHFEGYKIEEITIL